LREKSFAGGVFDPAAEAAVDFIGLLRRDWKSRPFKTAENRVFPQPLKAVPFPNLPRTMPFPNLPAA
jgi:hypothetical protein